MTRLQFSHKHAALSPCRCNCSTSAALVDGDSERQRLTGHMLHECRRLESCLTEFGAETKLVLRAWNEQR